MTSKAQLYLDSYDRQVRLAPGLLALLPISVTIAVLGLKHFAAVSVAIGVLASAGGPALLADVVREWGRAVERRLYIEWGGMPTTRLLRLREPTDNTVRREKWRTAISALAGVSLLSASREARDPAKADAQIESAVDDVRDLTRDPVKFRLLQGELRTYGFRRNMRGTRPVAVALALVGIVVTALVLAFSREARAHPGASIATLAVDGISILLWFVLVRDKWVCQAADRYAYQLMQGAVLANKS